MLFRFLSNRSFRLLLLWLDGAQLNEQIGVEGAWVSCCQEDIRKIAVGKYEPPCKKGSCRGGRVSQGLILELK